ncbi:MAG: hypothetical protein V3U35_03480 [Candidatus Neomarinimicrobiota bacterium]
MGDLTLTTGRKVALHDLTWAQREECENAITVRLHEGGSMEVLNLARARTMWCRYGLNLDGEDTLHGYDSGELDEIMSEVKERATRAKDPTGPAGSPSTSG